MPQTADRFFCQLYFRRPGVPEAEFERDVRHTIGSILYSISGDDAASGNGTAGSAAMVDRKRRSLAELRDPDGLPSWVSEADVDFYVREFTRSGFRGGLI